MAISVGKKSGSVSNTPAKVSGSAPSWMMKGKASKEALAEEEAKAEVAKAEMNKMFRFWLNVGQETSITFLDGNLDSEGVLDCLTFYEHTIQFAGGWKTMVCTASGTQGGEPCPICEAGDSAKLVAVFTVIDHSEFKGKNDKVYKDTPKLFVATRSTLKILQKIAAKQGGLAGVTFDVSRNGDKEPRVGGMFLPTQKRSLEELTETYGPDKVKVADYQSEIVYRTRDELLKMGIGKQTTTIGQADIAPASSSVSDEL